MGIYEPEPPLWEKIKPYDLFLENKELRKELEKRERELEEVKAQLKMCENKKFLDEILQEKEEKIKMLHKDLMLADQKIAELQEELKKYKERITEEDLKKSEELKGRIVEEVDIDDIVAHDSLIYHPDYRPPIEQQQLGNPIIETSTRPLSGDKILIPIIVATIESEEVFKTAKKTLYLIAGKRRWYYAKYWLKQKTIPAFVLHLKNLAEAIEINYRENFDRTDMGWFMQAKALGEYRRQTLYTTEKIAEIFNLSRVYVNYLLLLYDFVVSRYSSKDKTIVYQGKEYHIDLDYGLVKEESVPSIKCTLQRRPVSFSKAWEIYCYYKKQEEEKKKEEEQKKLKEMEEALKVLVSQPQKEEHLTVSEAAKTLDMSEKEIKEKKEIEELKESLTPEEKAEISKANVDLIYFEIPLKYTKDPEIKLCLNFQQGKCPFIKKIPPDLWKGIEEIKKQKEGSWINMSTEDFIITGATYWIMQKVHEFRKMKELSEEEKKKIAKMKKVFQKEYLKVDLSDYVQE
jgi:hypothetical protein